RHRPEGAARLRSGARRALRRAKRHPPLAPAAAAAGLFPQVTAMQFSCQLYSARNEASLDNTLRTLKQLGYEQVEGWGGQFADPAALARSLKAAGLVMPTAHMGFDLLKDTDAALRIADTVGITTVYCPAPPTADYRE